jgi:hypothetical protein
LISTTLQEDRLALAIGLEIEEAGGGLLKCVCLGGALVDLILAPTIIGEESNDSLASQTFIELIWFRTVYVVSKNNSPLVEVS